MNVDRANAPLRLVKSPRGGSMLALRHEIGFNRDLFARLLSISVSSLAKLEAGDSPGESVIRRLKEIERVCDSLAELVQRSSIGRWLLTANDAFDRHKHAEIME